MKTLTALHCCGNSVTKLFIKIFEAEKQEKAYEYQPGSTITAAEVLSEWTKGGKKDIEGYWRDAANTPTKTMNVVIEDDEENDDEARENEIEEFWQGKHEWIPTNMLAYVLFYACKHRDIAWIFLAEALRIPTRFVVVKPSKATYPRTTDNPLGLTGHVGSIYVGQGNKQQTKSQSKFHDALRVILKANLNDGTRNITLFEDQFVTHIGDWYWLGDTASVAATFQMTDQVFRSQECHYRFNDGRSQYTSWGPTMGDMAVALRGGWTIWLEGAKNIFMAARHLQLEQNSTRNATSQEYQAITDQGVMTAKRMQAMLV